MTFKTLKNALKNSDEYVTIGGGEPTVHPEFWKFLGYIMSQSETVHIITNGLRTEYALGIANLIQNKKISGRLSLDKYHRKVSNKVIKAFQKANAVEFINYNELNNRFPSLIKSGRSKTGRETCPCEDIFVMPNGDIKQCGCLDAPIFGNVNRKVSWPEEFGDCYKNTNPQIINSQLPL